MHIFWAAILNLQRLSSCSELHNVEALLTTELVRAAIKNIVYMSEARSFHTVFCLFIAGAACAAGDGQVAVGCWRCRRRPATITYHLVTREGGPAVTEHSK